MGGETRAYGLCAKREKGKICESDEIVKNAGWEQAWKMFGDDRADHKNMIKYIKKLLLSL